MLTGVVAYESLKTKEKSTWVIPKVVAVAYESLKTNEKSTWVIPKVVAVAYGSGRL